MRKKFWQLGEAAPSELHRFVAAAVDNVLPFRTHRQLNLLTNEENRAAV